MSNNKVLTTNKYRTPKATIKQKHMISTI